MGNCRQLLISNPNMLLSHPNRDVIILYSYCLSFSGQAWLGAALDNGSREEERERLNRLWLYRIFMPVKLKKIRITCGFIAKRNNLYW